MAVLKVQVERKDAGRKLDAWLSRAVPGVSLERARTLLREGRVKIRGKAAQANRKLWGNEEVEVDLPGPVKVRGLDGPRLPLLFESPDVVVVDKPSGMVVEPDGHHPSVQELLANQLEGLDVEGRAAPGVVHRLDKDTTGCVVLARNDRAVAALKGHFEAGRVTKEYLALVLGEPPQALRLEAPYGRDPEDPRRYTTRVASARRAELSFERMEQLTGGVALLRVRLETGRTHQIRVQLAEAGFPLLGDPLYGSAASREAPAARTLGRVALHARRLAIETLFDCESPLPADFERALATVRP